MSITDLPFEVSTKIFREATDVPGIYDTSPLSLDVYELRAWNTFNRSVKPYGFQDSTEPRMNSIRTRYNLSMVCKWWYDMAVELLYEDIEVPYDDNLKAVDALVQVLQRPIPLEPQSPSVESLRLGHVTKRLLIYATRRDNRLEPSSLSSLSTLLSLCPNLTVLEVDVIARPDALASLVTSSGAGLPPPRYLRWDTLFPTQLHLFSGPTPYFSMLEVLNLRIITCNAESLGALSASLPLLHTLEMSGPGTTKFLQFPPKWDLPSLGTVILHETPHPAFFEEHGHTIHSLDLSIAWSGGEHAVLTLSACPDLRYFHVYTGDMYQTVGPYQHLTHMHVRTRATGDVMHDFYWVISFNRSMETLFDTEAPALKCVRLTDFHFTSEPHFLDDEWDTFKELIPKWEKRGVSFEDEFGRLLELPPKPTDRPAQ